jgi:hypothetical protein
MYDKVRLGSGKAVVSADLLSRREQERNHFVAAGAGGNQSFDVDINLPNVTDPVAAAHATASAMRHLLQDQQRNTSHDGGPM